MKKSTHLRISSALAATICLGIGVTSLTSCSSTTSTEENVPVDSAKAAVDAPQVTVLEQGKNPQVLSYSLPLSTDDDAQKITRNISIGTGFNQAAVDSATDPQKAAKTPELLNDVSTLTLPVELSISTPPKSGTTSQQPNADSLRTLTQKYPLSEARSTAPQAEQSLIQSGTATSGWDLSPTGQISAVTFSIPTQASDKQRAFLEGHLTALIPQSVVFPTEPIGVDGSWSVSTRVAGDSTMLQTTTYTLKERNGDKVTLSAKVQQRPSLGSLSLPMQDGTEQKLNVLSSDTTSEGTLTLDLAQPIPKQGNLSFTTRVIYGEESSTIRIVQDYTTIIKYS